MALAPRHQVIDVDVNFHDLEAIDFPLLNLFGHFVHKFLERILKLIRGDSLKLLPAFGRVPAQGYAPHTHVGAVLDDAM